MRIALLFASAVLLQASAALADDPVMKACGFAMDLAEGNLRIVLNEPAKGSFPAEMRTSQAQLEASMRLLNLEQRYPGCMSGRYGKSNWPQYNAVRKLYDQAAKKFNFFDDRQDAGTSVDAKLQSCEAQLKSARSVLSSARTSPVVEKLSKDIQSTLESIESDNPGTKVNKAE